MCCAGRYTMPADMLYLRTPGICFVGCRLYSLPIDGVGNFLRHFRLVHGVKVDVAYAVFL